MIRINLLAVDRERSKRKAKFQTAQKVTLGSSLILVLAALVVVWWWWSLGKASTELDQRIADAERETARLRSLIQQVAQFEQQRGQLQQRVSLIEQLRKGQSGPVHMLDQLSRALPDTMWFTDLKQAGDDITIDGRCTSLTALSDFVANLESSNYFARPVEIVDSQVEAATQERPTDLIRFTVKAKFVQPTT
jgi:type IV pilus assembly protein PilN